MEEIRSALLAACAALALGACGAGKDGAHRAEGVVQGVDAAAQQVTIEHGEIPGLMRAMTMTFDVADPALLRGIEPGDGVRFAVEYSNGVYRVTELEEKN
jgi:Cu/Ag efflux protein CusF